MGPKVKPKVEEVVHETIQIENPPVTLENYLEYSRIYEELYENYSFEISRDASKKERELNQYTSSSLVYGEITYESFGRVYFYY